LSAEKSKAANVALSYETKGVKYSLPTEIGKFLSVDAREDLEISTQRCGFKVFSITYARKFRGSSVISRPFHRSKLLASHFRTDIVFEYDY